jgi:hypothetical protein
MSAASGTRIFGVRVGIDPKILVAGILVLAALLFWYNSRADEETSAPATAVRHAAPTAAAMPKSHIATTRRGTVSADRGTLRLRPVDATRGDVDPTLRLDLLERLQSVDEVPTGRSLFDIGPSPAQAAAMATQMHGPIIVPKQPAASPATVGPSGPAPLNIPLKFYGYVKPSDKRETCRGFFMDGDNVLVATEGEVLKQKYRVLELSAKSARLEDVQLKQQQTLPVEPEAVAQ